MPYITVKQSPKTHQISFEEIIAGEVKLLPFISHSETNTRTVYVQAVTPQMVAKINLHAMLKSLSAFCQKHAALYDVETHSLYRTFFIPKKSGGMRQINEPVPELMEALRELKDILEKEMFAMYHTSAFAYIKGRCTIDCVKKHQKNDSHWFLKIDFSNFFGNTNMDFVMRMLAQIFPFSEVMRTRQGQEVLRKALQLCFLDGGLPQGTPISPMLTNLIMIPIDHRLYNCLRDFNKQGYVYTRYADDIIISSRRDFQKEEIIQFVRETLNEFHAPFSLKDEKTRYGSRAGSNWNLGVMLNKDNEITVGNKNKKYFRAIISNYINDRRNNVKWDLHDVQVMRGHMEYYRMVEPKYIAEIIKFNNEKYGVDLMALIKEDLSS